ncbi:MAG: rhodanese-like domain-containing protein [Candidatus Binataceae bacterium]
MNHREVMSLLSSGAIIAEVLPRHEYKTTHIKGAIHLPLPRLLREAQRLPSGQPVVVYCRDSL